MTSTLHDIADEMEVDVYKALGLVQAVDRLLSELEVDREGKTGIHAVVMELEARLEAIEVKRFRLWHGLRPTQAAASRSILPAQGVRTDLVGASPPG